MRKLLLLTFTLFIMGSCSKKEDDVSVPSYVLSKEQYARLMADYTLAEAAGNVNPMALGGAKFDSAYAFNPLKENNITQEQYDSSVAFYSRHPELYKEICEMVLSSLSAMKAERANTADTQTKK